MTPALVLQVRDWEIRDDKREQVRKGVTIYYADLGSPLSGRSKGYEVLHVSGSEAACASLAQVPGFYDLQFRQRAGRESGKVELSLSGLRYLGPLNVPHNGQE
jgi:hypothetical protein